MFSSYRVILIPALIVSGCASTGVDKAAYAASSMRAIQTELSKGVQQIDAVVKAAGELSSGEGNMPQQYAAYSNAVAAVKSQADRIRGLRQDMEAREAAFVSDWDQRLPQIQNADLRRRAQDRRDGAVKSFDDLEDQADIAKSRFDPWMSDVTDIMTYLQNDLNKSGVASLSDVFKRVDENADVIKQDVDALVQRLGTMIDAIQAAVPPPPEKSSGS